MGSEINRITIFKTSYLLQSLRLDGRKVCNIKRVDISQAESNKAKVCALPPIHLTFFEGRQVRCARQGIIVLLQWLWEWKGLVQREGRARQVISALLQRLAKTTRTGATVGASPLVKSNMVYTLCKHMVYMLSITNEHKK